MALVVIKEFHLNGVMRQVGEELTAELEALVKDDVELMKRVVRRAETAVQAEVERFLPRKSNAASDPAAPEAK